jgi:hypothetical protein
MFLAVIFTIGAGFLHGYGLSESSAATEGAAFGMAFFAVVLAIMSLPAEPDKVLDRKGPGSN